MDMNKLKELDRKADESLRAAEEKLDRIAILQTLDPNKCPEYFQYLSDNNKNKGVNYEC